MKTTFVLISDIHLLLDEFNHIWPKGDILIIAGDILNQGTVKEFEIFLEWSKILPYKKIIVIAGNHDKCLDEYFDKNKIGIKEYCESKMTGKLIYLRDSQIIINNIVIYGTPWQPRFGYWAFNLLDNNEELYSKYSKIPDNIDILISHGPPYGILDKTDKNSKSLGSKMLLKRIKEIKFKYCIFGHIHGGYGTYYDKYNNKTYINASTCNERYVTINKPIVITINK